MLEIERAEGIYLYAKDGTRYIDGISGIAVSNVGHSHPRVVDAVCRQASRYMHLMVYGEFIETPQVQYAAALCALLPPQLQNVYFTNSGAEATEGAMKLAKRHTGRTEIIAFKNSYHGSTQGALSIIGSERFKQNYRPLLPGIRQLRYGVLDDLVHITQNTAAVFFEPIQAESGITMPDKHYVQALRERCTLTGALLVFDEAQTAFGRTGAMFAMEHFEVTPDILLLAKALGGGMPLGAFISSKEIMQSLAHRPALGHITTFGGHPVCCAAGLAALEVLQTENLIAHAETKGALLHNLLAPANIPISRAGMMFAMHFQNENMCRSVISECLRRGLLTDWFLFAPASMRIALPLTVTHAQLNAVADIILQSIRSCQTN